MQSRPILQDLARATSEAVAHYWLTRKQQLSRQAETGRADQGARGSVTGGAQMDGFVRLLARVLVEAGLDEAYIHHHRALELPGYFRPTKEWDLLAVREGRLLVALEAKSHAGPSFGNNFNNRTEEAMGSALDLWTAYREGAFSTSPPPFLGYLLMLEDCPRSRMRVRANEPHFKVFPEFVGASYAQRYELFCRKLVRERHYSAAAFIMSAGDTGQTGAYREPAPDLALSVLAKALAAHVSAYSS